VPAISATIPLNLPELGFTNAALYNIGALAGGTKDLRLCIINGGFCALFLNITGNL
jgi:hypothetical protein